MPHSGRTTSAIAFHSGYGHTAVIGEAVAWGAAGADGEVVPISVDTITGEQWAQLDAADAIIFGAPTSMGTASAAFPGFAEASGRRWPTDAGPEAVHKPDIATVEHLGARVARQATIFRAGRTAITS